MGANCTTCLDSNTASSGGRKPRARKNTLTTRNSPATKKGSKRKASRVKADVGSGSSGLTGSDRTHSDDAGRGEGALHHWNIAAKKNPLVAPMAVGLTEQRPRNVRRPTMEFQASPAAHLVEVSDVDSTTSSRKTGDGAATATPSGLGPRMFVAANHTPSPATNSFTMVSRHSTGMSQKEGLNETIGPEDLERAQAAVVEDGLDLSLPAATTNSISGERRSEDMTATLGPSDLARALPVAVRSAHT